MELNAEQQALVANVLLYAKTNGYYNPDELAMKLLKHPLNVYCCYCYGVHPYRDDWPNYCPTCLPLEMYFGRNPPGPTRFRLMFKFVEFNGTRDDIKHALKVCLEVIFESTATALEIWAARDQATKTGYGYVDGHDDESKQARKLRWQQWNNFLAAGVLTLTPSSSSSSSSSSTAIKYFRRIVPYFDTENRMYNHVVCLYKSPPSPSSAASSSTKSDR